MNDQDVLAQRRDEWIAAVNAGSVERYTRLLSQDVFWLPLGGPPLIGRDAVGAWLEPFLQQFDYDLSLRAPVVQLSEGWALERGTFTSRMRLRGNGQWQQHTGVYVAIWQRAADDLWYLRQYLDLTGVLPPTFSRGSRGRRELALTIVRATAGVSSVRVRGTALG